MRANKGDTDPLVQIPSWVHVCVGYFTVHVHHVVDQMTALSTHKGVPQLGNLVSSAPYIVQVENRWTCDCNT